VNVNGPTMAIVASLVVGLGFGALGRGLLSRRPSVGWSDSVVAGLVGAALGSVVARLVDAPRAVLVGLAVVVSLGTTVGLLVLIERRQARRRLPQGGVAELAAGGETAHVEFKSSARYNRQTGQRDERMEQVVVKTLAGFLNAEGGVLLIGVADDGSVTGLADDYPLMKEPNRDHFELWLRDLLIRVLGPIAASSVRISFEDVAGDDVCLVRAVPAERPVFVRAGKGQPPVFYVRLGNSTRALAVDDAVTYCADRWGRRALRRRR
jgi:uncharacterized membrane protein YeaQ/YmgE (transglycosylase-associated protein family)